jgi:hypothetical protein
MAAETFRCITQIDGHLRVEATSGSADEIGAIYRAMAHLCIQGQLRHLLVKPADDNPEGEHALRVSLTTMVLAGIPPDFRLALVAITPRIEARYLNAPRDLRLANIDAQIFASEEAAARWLDGPGGAPAP